MGVANSMSAMPTSLSRSTAPAMKTVTRNIASRLKMPSICATTVGALRLMLPMAPPICTESLVVAPKAIRAMMIAKTHSSGCFSW